MLVVQVGGPAYRIGMGGGAASSMEQGANVQELDFNAVQRGDPEMEQRVNRLMRACVELGEANPIVSAHDLGAGGDCNALPEIVEPAGAVIDLRAIPVGDQTLSVLEIWGNESQESNALLIRPAQLHVLETIAGRENVPLAVVGRVTGDGVLVLYDAADDSRPVDLPLDDILGQLPPKKYEFQRRAPRGARRADLTPLVLRSAADLRRVLDLVLRLPAIGSKRFLTNKVDLDVTGLVIQRQLVGPRHLPLSDYAVIAQTYDDPSGTALSLGEQPIKGLISPEAGVRMAVAEALLNMAGAVITDITRHQVLGQLDAGREAARRGRLALRRGLRAARHPHGAGRGHRRRQGQPLHGQPGRRPRRPQRAGQGSAASWCMAPYALMPDVERAGDLRPQADGQQAVAAPGGRQAPAGRERVRSGARPTGRRGAGHRRCRPRSGRSSRRCRTWCRSGAILACHDVSDGGL